MNYYQIVGFSSPDAYRDAPGEVSQYAGMIVESNDLMPSPHLAGHYTGNITTVLSDRPESGFRCAYVICMKANKLTKKQYESLRLQFIEYDMDY